MGKLAAVLVSGSIVILAADMARAADAAFCQAYATQAVAQFNQNLSIPGCFKGADGRWHNRFDVHYGWCVGAPEAAVRAEGTYRAARLRDCEDRAYGAQ